jgi:hypothetical protein
VQSLSRRFTHYKISKQFYRISSDRPRNGDELNDIETTLTALIFGDKRLMFTQFISQRLLSDTRGMSHCDKGLDQPGIFGGFEGFLHAPPGPLIGGGQSDPRIGLSQNWILPAIGGISHVQIDGEENICDWGMEFG